MHVHVIPDEEEIVRPNKIYEKSSELPYHKKGANTDTSTYDRLLNALKKLYKLYNPTMQNLHEPVIEDNYKVMVYTRVIPIAEHEDDKIQWACNMSISTDSGEPETIKKAMTRQNGHLWKISAISEVKNSVKKGMDSDKEKHR